MIWIIWEEFTKEWLERAERKEDECVDDGDRFISLWIAFNGWMKGRFDENGNDKMLLDETKKLAEFNDSFNHLKQDDFLFKKNLEKLATYTVVNMKKQKDKDEYDEYRYDGTLESLIDVLYQVRCNLFHGRKEINANSKDFELVSLSLSILLPLFKTHLSRTKALES